MQNEIVAIVKVMKFDKMYCKQHDINGSVVSFPLPTLLYLFFFFFILNKIDEFTIKLTKLISLQIVVGWKRSHRSSDSTKVKIPRKQKRADESSDFPCPIAKPSVIIRVINSRRCCSFAKLRWGFVNYRLRGIEPLSCSWKPVEKWKSLRNSKSFCFPDFSFSFPVLKSEAFVVCPLSALRHIYLFLVFLFVCFLDENNIIIYNLFHFHKRIIKKEL